MPEPSADRAAEIAARNERADELQPLYRAHDAARASDATDDERRRLEAEIRALLERGLR